MADNYDNDALVQELVAWRNSVTVAFQQISLDTRQDLAPLERRFVEIKAIRDDYLLQGSDEYSLEELSRVHRLLYILRDNTRNRVIQGMFDYRRFTLHDTVENRPAIRAQDNPSEELRSIVRFPLWLIVALKDATNLVLSLETALVEIRKALLSLSRSIRDLEYVENMTSEVWILLQALRETQAGLQLLKQAFDDTVPDAEAFKKAVSRIIELHGPSETRIDASRDPGRTGRMLPAPSSGGDAPSASQESSSRRADEWYSLCRIL